MPNNQPLFVTALEHLDLRDNQQALQGEMPVPNRHLVAS